MQLVSVWVTNTLSPWQLGEFVVACYPFYPWCPALVELSALLTPCDSPPVRINADCCEAAAQAAALAAELGYMDAGAYMQQRCLALQVQLDFVEHTQGQLFP